MEVIFGPPMSPDVSEGQRASNALVKLIRKLRWMGMEDDAERVQITLATCDMKTADSVVAEPIDTD